MANFLFIYRGGDAEEGQFSPEEMQQFMQKWMAWIQEGFAKGWMVDPGDALLPDSKVVNAKKVVTDGPFAESKEMVGGYTVVKAESLAEAAELTKGCPIFMTGGQVEVRQMAGLSPPK
jgi:hypothetical protein